MPNVPSQVELSPAAEQPVTMGELLSALSFALDSTEGAPAGHSVRSCLLGMRLGIKLGLSGPALDDLYYALLLKDIGCSSNSARMAAAFTADDQSVKRNFKFLDREKLGKPNREALSFVWNNVAPDENVWTRLQRIYRMVRAPGDLTAEMIEARCERGAAILFKLGMPTDTCAAVYTLDEHWNGNGLPDHLAGRDIPLLGRICAVAQDLDLFGTEFSPAQAMANLAERSAAWYDPEVVYAAAALHADGTLWSACTPGSSLVGQYAAVRDLQPGTSTALAAHDIDLICSGFADVIDAKSPFTHRHAIATAEAAVLLGNTMGLAPGRIATLRRAALLHDIGMLGVSNTILDKPGPLSESEWTSVHHHPILSQQILSRVRAFSEIAQLAGQHHERLDGTGYPFHLTADQLSLESRILATADVFSALMESRPYRPDLNPAQVEQQLAQQVPNRLDPQCFDAMISVLDQLAALPLDDVPALSTDAANALPMFDPPPFRFHPTQR